METKEVLSIALKIGADSEGAKKALSDLAKGLREVEKTIKELDFRDLASKIDKVGHKLSNTGKGLSSLLTNAASAYIASAGKFDVKVQRWNAAQQEIQAAYTRIGAVSLEALTPYLEKAATLIDKFATFIEKNPWIVKAAAGTGATLMVAGNLASTISTLMTLKGTLGKVMSTMGITTSGLMGMAKSIAPMLGQAGIYGGAAVGGAFIGKFAGNVINQAIGQEQQSWEDIAETARKSAAIPLMLISKGLKNAGFDDAAHNIWGLSDSVMELGKSSETAADQVMAAVGANETFAENNVQMFIDFQKEMQNAQADYDEQIKELERATAESRIQILQDFAQRARSAESSYVSSRNALIADFEQSQAQAYQDFYAQQAAAQRAYNVEMQRLAEDHKNRLRQLEKEHNAKVADLVASRDALGLAKENADYKDAVKEENENYNREKRRRAEDFKARMAEMASNFAIEQERRRQEFEQQLAEKQLQHNLEMNQIREEREAALKELEDHNKETLKKLKEGYDKEIKMIQTNFVDRLNAMSQSISGNTQAWIKYMQDQATAFQNWLNTQYSSVQSTETTGIARAAGGGVSAGRTYLVGENGPELFTARHNGSIIPAGLTAQMVRGSGGSAKNMNVVIEGRGLTMREVLSEMDKRFGTFERQMTRAFS